MKKTIRLAALVCGSLLAGCAPQAQEPAVPTAAQLMNAGNDVLFTAPSRGTVYIYDRQAKRLVYSGEIGAGKRVKVDQQTHRILVDDRLVVDKVDGGHTQEIYFQPTAGPALTDPSPSSYLSNPAPAQPAQAQ